ncbi:MAG TPA: response regulator [Candidatus Paceibacterota bacterium]|nr:response regulator [Candidatus Paceibacterota bacterium]
MNAPANKSPHRVLVIDDNPAIHEDFRKILGEASSARKTLRHLHSALFNAAKPCVCGSSFEIDCAFQGEEGLELVRKAVLEGRPYALAFVDGRMPPGWDGIETIGHLWREQPDLQVVLCTAYSDHAWDEIRQALGETDSLVILKKPFDNLEALQLAHALARKWDLGKQVQGRLNDLNHLVREQTEQTRHTMALFEASIDQSPSGILIAENPEVTIRWANEAALRILGQTGQPVTGIAVGRNDAPWKLFRPDGSLCPHEDHPLTRAVLKGEITQGQEFMIRTSQGEDRWISTNAAPIRNADGRIAAGILIFQDITERKHAEEQRERLQNQLTQAQKMESVGRLAGGVAHDFNNMLQTILGNVELALEKTPAPGPLQEDLHEIRKAAQRSTDLTRQLLSFARRQTISPKVLDLNDTVSGMLKMLHRLIGENIQLSWLPGAKLWPVKVDPSQIDQILANLLVNARDAIAGAGRITIETANLVLDATALCGHVEAAPGDYVALSVTDTGCGMNDETRSHLFEPFFTTKGVGKGTGLGLATVFGIVQQNRGLINVRTAPGQGTTFRICLPRSEARPETAQTTPPRPMGGTETVLLVEDESQVLNLGRRILIQHGYKVLGAPTPEAALALAKDSTEPIHLLLTDVIMPGMNGKELHARLRAAHPDLRCLFMSGYTADVIAHHGVLDPGVEFLQKPFTLQTLAQRVREILDQRQPTP